MTSPRLGGRNGMSPRRDWKRVVWPCVIFDINTQRDFLDPAAACPAWERERVSASLRRIMQWAEQNDVPVISTVDSHRRDEVGPRSLPPHCIDGTRGQEKVDFSLFPSYVKVEGDNTLSIPVDLFGRYQQVIFRKRTSDFFLNARADRFITQLPVEEYVVAGLSPEGSVKAIVLGLVARHRRVTLVVDACGCFDRSKADLAMRQMEAKGVRLTTVAELAQRQIQALLHYPHVARAQVSLRNGLYASLLPLKAGHNGTNGRAKLNGHAAKGVNGRCKLAPEAPVAKPADDRTSKAPRGRRSPAK